MRPPVALARLPLLLPGMLALLAGTWAGLARLGWLTPAPAPLPPVHGPLMVAGFLGTVISLERAVAWGRPAGYLAPALAGAGALAMLVGAPWPVGPVLSGAAAVGLVLLFAALWRRDAGLHLAVMAAGAVAFAGGVVCWAGRLPLAVAAWWWAGFLVLTITGERIELNRVKAPSPTARRTVAALALLVLASLFGLLLAFDLAVRTLGGSFAALAVWLLLHDVARSTVRLSGLTRFTATCLLSGYVWLGVSGVLALTSGGEWAGPVYDAQLHALFLGFVLSMILGHAPVIFPAVLRVPIPYSPLFYGPLVLLHGTLALRVAADLLSHPQGRALGALGNAVAIVLFLVGTVRAAIAGWLGARSRH